MQSTPFTASPPPPPTSKGYVPSILHGTDSATIGIFLVGVKCNEPPLPLPLFHWLETHALNTCSPRKRTKSTIAQQYYRILLNWCRLVTHAVTGRAGQGKTLLMVEVVDASLSLRSCILVSGTKMAPNNPRILPRHWWRCVCCTHACAITSRRTLTAMQQLWSLFKYADTIRWPIWVHYLLQMMRHNKGYWV